jgi:hypothetical protein
MKYISKKDQAVRTQFGRFGRKPAAAAVTSPSKTIPCDTNAKGVTITVQYRVLFRKRKIFKQI